MIRHILVCLSFCLLAAYAQADNRITIGEILSIRSGNTRRRSTLRGLLTRILQRREFLANNLSGSLLTGWRRTLPLGHGCGAIHERWKPK